MLLIILFASSIVWLLRNYWKNKDKRKLYNQMKGDLKCWPIVGHALYISGTSKDRMMGIQEFGRQALKCGGATCIWLANQMYVVMVDPVDIDVVLKRCLEKSDFYTVLKQLLGDGSVFAPVSTWHPRRKKNLPSFSQRRLTQYMIIHSRNSGKLVDRLQAEVESGAFSIWDYVTDFSISSFCEIALGVKLDNHIDTLKFKKAVERHAQIQSTRILPWFQSDFLFWFSSSYNDFKSTIEYTKNFLNKLVDEQRESIRQEHANPNTSDAEGFQSILEHLIGASDEELKFTDKEIREELLTLLLASIDTSGATISFTAVLLSHHQNIQDKIYKELKEYFGDSKRPVLVEDLNNLKYLEAVIKETLRLYPPVPFISRRVEEVVTLPSGTTLVPNISVIIHVWSLHRSKKCWGPDADLFKPERWFLEGELKQPEAYMPFSRGPRNCIGFKYAMMSITIVLVDILRWYRIVPQDVATNGSAFDHTKTLNIKYDMFLKDVDNFMIKLVWR